MRTQPELVSLQRKWGQIISYLGRAVHRLKLDINSGLSLIRCCLQLNSGLYTKILLMAMSQLKNREPHWSVIETLAEPKVISRMM